MKPTRILAIVLKLAAMLCLCAFIGRGQIPAPQVPLTGNIGCEGFPCLNSGTLIFASDANHTMTAQESSATGGIKITSDVALTATRSLVIPSTFGKLQFISVGNSSTGGQSVTVCVGTGTTCGGGGTITIPNGQSATGVWYDGTNVTGTLQGGGSGDTITSPGATITVGGSPTATTLDAKPTSINSTTCTPGGSCTITALPPAQVTYEAAAVSDGGAAFAAALTRYDNNQPQTGSVAPATSALGYMAFQASPSLPQYAEQTVNLPPYWTGTSAYINFYSAATTGSVEWEIQTACTSGTTVVGGPIWGTPVTVTTAVNSTSGGAVTTAILSNIAAPTVNGCPSASATVPSIMSYRIFRAASDSAAGNANLIGVTLVTNRSQ